MLVPPIPGRSWWWGIVLACVFVFGVGLAAYGAVSYIKSSERHAIATASAEVIALSNPLVKALTRQRDSLYLLLQRRDTLVVRRLQVLHDTVWIPKDTNSGVRYTACRVQLDSLASECDAFRVTSLAALQTADTTIRYLMQVDSARALQLAAGRRADSAKAVALRRKDRFQGVTRTVCATSLITNALQWGVRSR